ncbi:hypothetical protein LWF01_00290 [Saxibacter everestensis]|uniref:Uncharacterized protein n=1 Tax=Saxibacter everestensis TaxID=2909229 RepID=A0ABY8QTC4_9MICO|nr:hypothetical protein LWF01_00290 [Brevibacteriaceae bacterium ZFBP1038]
MRSSIGVTGYLLKGLLVVIPLKASQLPLAKDVRLHGIAAALIIDGPGES